MLIYNTEMFKEFINIIWPSLKEDEVAFTSLSARNKYLTPEEREQYGLGRTEMFARQILHSTDPEYVLSHVMRYEVPEGAYRTKLGFPIPEKCIVMYLNVNLSSMKKALQEFYAKSMEMLFSESRDVGHYQGFQRVDTLLQNCVQRSRSKKRWIDVDFDVDDESYVNEFHHHLCKMDISHITVVTHGGWHILLQRDTIHHNFHSNVTKLNDEAKKASDKYEIVINKNEMIPAPGTVQAGFGVRVDWSLSQL